MSSPFLFLNFAHFFPKKCTSEKSMKIIETIHDGDIKLIRRLQRLSFKRNMERRKVLGHRNFATTRLT